MILPLMSAYNTLYDEAAENYGLITTEMAERNGVSGMSLVMLERRGVSSVSGGASIVKNGADNASIKPLHGIPAQPVEEAIRASRGSIMDERLVEAANRAKELGLLLSDTHEQLIQELNHAQ